jgi:hypothetical protein
MQAGYLTPQGFKVEYDDILHLTDEDLEQLFELPAPIIKMLIEPPRNEPIDVVHVTELVGDMRNSILKRRLDWYEDLGGSMWKAVGTGVHKAIEDSGIQSDHENTVTTVIDGITVTGTIDWYIKDEIWDWKTTSAWGGKRLNEALIKGDVTTAETGYWEQLEMYAALKAMNGSTPKGGKLWVIFRDWQRAQSIKYTMYPDKPFAEYRHPGLSLGRTFVDGCIDKLKARVATWKDCLAKDNDDLPPCENLFGKDSDTRLSKKCLSYCPVNDQCNQFKIEQEMNRH